MKIILGSASGRKINITQKVFSQFFDKESIQVDGFSANSGVPETPYDQETFIGSNNRALRAKENNPGADFYVGMESGLIERYGHIYEEAWVTVINKDGKKFYGYSSGLKVPDYILKRMDELKMEHSEVMTIIEEEFGKLPNDTWGTYSGGVILREISLEESLRNALIQVVAPKNSFYKI